MWDLARVLLWTNELTLEDYNSIPDGNVYQVSLKDFEELKKKCIEKFGSKQ
jgi:hypothetical protein